MKIIVIALVFSAGYFLWWIMSPPHGDSRKAFLSGQSMQANLVVASATIPIRFEPGLSVGEAVVKAGFTVTEHDIFSPAAHERLLPGTTIQWQPARSIGIEIDGTKKEIMATSTTVATVLSEAGVTLDEDDLVEPLREETISDGEEITVTRVEIREEVKETKIAYETKVEEDDELSWRQKIVTQKGENGIKRTTYRVSYHNGTEVNRKALSTETMKDPVAEIVTQGTYVKLGKKHTGQASWYAWTGTMAAANPWLPKGSYVKVTNVDNGKSVIVVINDRGPFVPGRIIDLDKVAFEKIASLGAGVINVKMEEITN